MRRYLLIFMLCLLPLQWSWAAAARVCEHEQGAAHFGHHEHRHSADAPTLEGEGSSTSHAALQAHPDCHSCHGLGLGFLPTLETPPAQWSSGFVRPYRRAAFPEPPPGSLLRPPAFFVA